MQQQTIKLGPILYEEELSIVNRQFAVVPIDIGEDVECADGTIHTYYVDTKDQLAISWENIPGDDDKTADQNMGRDYIKSQFDTHSNLSLIITDETGSTKTYTVKFMDYKEEFLRPLAGDNTWRYNLAIVLREV